MEVPAVSEPTTSRLAPPSPKQDNRPRSPSSGKFSFAASVFGSMKRRGAGSPLSEASRSAEDLAGVAKIDADDETRGWEGGGAADQSLKEGVGRGLQAGGIREVFAHVDEARGPRRVHDDETDAGTAASGAGRSNAGSGGLVRGHSVGAGDIDEFPAARGGIPAQPTRRPSLLPTPAAGLSKQMSAASFKSASSSDLTLGWSQGITHSPTIMSIASADTLTQGEHDPVIGSPSKHGGLRMKFARARSPKHRMSSADALEDPPSPTSPIGGSANLGSMSPPSAATSPSITRKHSSPFRRTPSQTRSSSDLPASLTSHYQPPLGPAARLRNLEAGIPIAQTHSPLSSNPGSRHNSSSSLYSRGTPTSVSRRSSTFTNPDPVKETNVIVRDYDPQTGNKMINKYMIIRELGRGCHGKVKLAVDVETGEKWAIKIVDKHARRRFQGRLGLSHRLAAAEQARSLAAGSGSGGGSVKVALPNPHLEKIKREIAILKKCSHPHVVGLKEVIDDPGSEKIYLVLEYLAGGDIRWHDYSDPPKPTITEDEARRIFRDVVCGVQYLHHQGIVHRDIKPANLLWTADRRVKISDFGVSVFINPPRRMSDQTSTHSPESDEETNEIELAKTAGSPAFFAPELCGVGDDEDPKLFGPFNPFGSNASSGTPGSLGSHGDVGGGGTTSWGSTPGVSNQSSFVSDGIGSGRGSAGGSNLASGVTSAVASTQVSSSSLVSDSGSGGGLGAAAGAGLTPDKRRRGSSRMDLMSEESARKRPGIVPEEPADYDPPRHTQPPSRPQSPPARSISPPSALSTPFQPPPIGQAIDIWAMGVTLYCFVFGRVPFMAETEFELFNVISKKPLEFPDEPAVDEDLRDLLSRILVKDPMQRITLEEIKVHPWTTKDMTPGEREAWLVETDPSYGDPLEVTDEDVRGAVTIMGQNPQTVEFISQFGGRIIVEEAHKEPAECIDLVSAAGDIQAIVKNAPRSPRKAQMRPKSAKPDPSYLTPAATEEQKGHGQEWPEDSDSYFSSKWDSSRRPSAAVTVVTGPDEWGLDPSSLPSASPPRSHPTQPMRIPTSMPAATTDRAWYRWNPPPPSTPSRESWAEEAFHSPSREGLWGTDLSRGGPAAVGSGDVYSDSSSEEDDGVIAERERVREWARSFAKGGGGGGAEDEEGGVRGDGEEEVEAGHGVVVIVDEEEGGNSAQNM
ncbi:hypothetical protein HK104_010125 [Borealophlyctis nickersoniae]|nr:hypothetical protein HK104_010125 [Borealophlyctis nickersoniae]